MNPEVNKKKTPARKPDAELRRELTVIDDERQIKAILNPKRARIIDMLIAESATAKQVADAMGGTTGRIHYHIKELEKARLIEIVDRVEKGGVLEKYYRAVARNFYVGRGLGEHSQLGQDVRTMVSDSMLRWRRKQILRVDQNRIAERILDQCLLCEPGQIVALRGDPVNHEIITLFHHAIESRGLQCVVMYGRDSWSQLLARWKDDIAAVITIEEPLAGAGIDDVVLRRTSSSALYTRYLEELTELGRQFTYPELACEDPAVGELLSAGKRVLYFGYPSRQKAEILGLDFDALHDACWTALDVDYEQLTARCTAIQRLLGGADKVHLSSPGGTDLVFSIAGQEILADGGVRSDWETERGRAFGHLPAGMVMAPVVKGSADGIVVSEMADYLGERIIGIRLEFRRGKVVSATADENEALLKMVLARSSGEVESLSGFELGVNPRIRNPIGYAIWDIKSHGNATINIGDNRLLGGDTRASLVWCFHVTRPTVRIDGRTVVSSGVYEHEQTEHQEV